MGIGVVANDAGGAEVVSSFVKQNFADYRWFATGPAEAIFERKLEGPPSEDLVSLVEGVNRLICGTSGTAMLEWEAIGLARDTGVPSVAFLDHWTNYRARFLRSDRIVLPDEVWVSDAHAERRAQVELPTVRLRRVENVYLEETVGRIAELRSTSATSRNGLEVLYVTEPLDAEPLTGGDQAFPADAAEKSFTFFLENLRALESKHQVTSIVVRPHPSESLSDYLWTEAVDRRIVVSRELSLEGQIASADLVVGVSSMALVVALLAGRRTITSIPPGFGAISLPFPEIEYLRDL